MLQICLGKNTFRSEYASEIIFGADICMLKWQNYCQPNLSLASLDSSTVIAAAGRSQPKWAFKKLRKLQQVDNEACPHMTCMIYFCFYAAYVAKRGVWIFRRHYSCFSSNSYKPA